MRVRSTAALLLALGAAFLRPGWAQETRLWSPAAYVAAALEASPETARSRLSRKAASYRWKSALASAALPALSWSADSVPYGHTPADSYQFHNWRLNASDVGINTGLRWNLFNSFADERVRPPPHEEAADAGGVSCAPGLAAGLLRPSPGQDTGISGGTSRPRSQFA